MTTLEMLAECARRLAAEMDRQREENNKLRNEAGSNGTLLATLRWADKIDGAGPGVMWEHGADEAEGGR
jgi:hypothetical protein